MAISQRASGTWTQFNASATVTIPGGATTGDRMYLIAGVKPYTTTLSVSGWTEIGQHTDGTVAQGNGTGSMRIGVWYKDHSGSESDPTLTVSGANVGAHVIIVFQKDSGESWGTPAYTTGEITSGSASFTVTCAADPGIAAGDLVFSHFAIRNDSSTITRATTAISATGITWSGDHVEYPATHFSTIAGNDCATDGGYRIASSGTSSAAPDVTGTLAAGETGALILVRQRAANPTVSGSFTADAVIKREQTGSFTTNAVTQRNISGSFTADAVITAIVTITGSFTGDGITKATVASTYAADSIVKSSASASASADSLLRLITSASATADSVIFRSITGAATADAVISDGSFSFTADAIIYTPRHRHHRIRDHFGYENDQYVTLSEAIGPWEEGTPVNTVINDILARLAALESSTHRLGSFTTNAVLLAPGSHVETATGTWRGAIWFDSVVKRGMTGSATASAVITSGGSFTADAVLRGYGSFTAYAVIV